MNPKANKISVKYALAPEIALALVAAGIDNPAKIRAASDKELKAVPGIGDAITAKIRSRVG